MHNAVISRSRRDGGRDLGSWRMPIRSGYEPNISESEATNRCQAAQVETPARPYEVDMEVMAYLAANSEEVT